MATSGTIDGTIKGYQPYLRINWSRIETDVGGNRSKLKLQLYLMYPYRLKYSATKYGVLQGTSFSSSTSVNGTGSLLLRTQEIWVGHNADGSKTQTLSASYNLDVTYSGSKLYQLTVSGPAHITAIPRASTLSAFSFNAHLKNGTANKINYTVSRKSGSFRHQIQIRDGSTTVLTWDNVSSNGSTSIDLTASNVNTLLNRMETTTTKNYTLRIATRSGVDGGWIGSAVTRSATATVDADVKPSLSGLSVSQVGNSVSTDYLQNISKVKASFTRSAGYGASVTSSRIIVRRVSGGANSQTINSNNGTTSNAINLTGTYEVIAQATDSRGRSGTQLKATFTSVAYSPPVVTNFTATRQGNEGEASKNIDWNRVGKHSGISGKNSATGLLQYRVTGGTWTQIESIKDAAGSWSKKGTVEGLSAANSYEFRFTLTDSFGYSDSQTVTVSTARVVLDIHKNDGVGIGKIHERGVLDLDGDVYSNGKLYAFGGLEIAGGSWADQGEGFRGIQLNNSDILGTNGIRFNDVSQPDNGEGLMFLKNGKTSGSTDYADYDNLFMNNGDIILNGVRTGDVLWSGATWMNGSQTCTPSKKLSECPNGWVLVWSGYSNGSGGNWDWNYTYIHKRLVNAGRAGSGIQCHIARGQGTKLTGAKYIYVHDGHFTGNDTNTTGAQDGMVLREVLAW